MNSTGGGCVAALDFGLYAEGSHRKLMLMSSTFYVCSTFVSSSLSHISHMVAQGHSDNVLLTLIKAFIPAILFSSPLWLKKWLKHHYRLDKSTDPENTENGDSTESTPIQQNTENPGSTQQDPQNTDNTDNLQAPGDEKESELSNVLFYSVLLLLL